MKRKQCLNSSAGNDINLTSCKKEQPIVYIRCSLIFFESIQVAELPKCLSVILFLPKLSESLDIALYCLLWTNEYIIVTHSRLQNLQATKVTSISCFHLALIWFLWMNKALSEYGLFKHKVCWFWLCSFCELCFFLCTSSCITWTSLDFAQFKTTGIEVELLNRK